LPGEVARRGGPERRPLRTYRSMHPDVGAAPAVPRRITSYHQDSEGDWERAAAKSGSVSYFFRTTEESWLLMPASSWLLDAQRFEAGDDIEQLLVDAALAHAMEGPVEVRQQLIDVLVGSLHRGQTAGVLARE
jgi:hypothetical protein